MMCPPQDGFVPNYNTLGGDWAAGSFRVGVTHLCQEFGTELFGPFSERARFGKREMGPS